MSRTLVVLAASVIVAVGARPPSVGAHAFLERAEPRVGSSVSASPRVLTLTFTEGIEAAFSRIEVLDGSGKPVAVGPLEHSAAETATVTLPALPPGSYTVKWAVVSVDTHATEGSFQFTVKAP